LLLPCFRAATARACKAARPQFGGTPGRHSPISTVQALPTWIEDWRHSLRRRPASVLRRSIQISFGPVMFGRYAALLQPVKSHLESALQVSPGTMSGAVRASATLERRSRAAAAMALKFAPLQPRPSSTRQVAASRNRASSRADTSGADAATCHLDGAARGGLGVRFCGAFARFALAARSRSPFLRLRENSPARTVKGAGPGRQGSIPTIAGVSSVALSTSRVNGEVRNLSSQEAQFTM